MAQATPSHQSDAAQNAQQTKMKRLDINVKRARVFSVDVRRVKCWKVTDCVALASWINMQPNLKFVDGPTKQMLISGGKLKDTMGKWHAELMDTTNVLVQIIRGAGTRNDVVLTYAMSIVSSDDTDWPVANGAIQHRWSLAAVDYIKRKAWKLIEERNA